MNFSEALSFLKSGACLQREGWNGSGMFVFLMPDSQLTVSREELTAVFPRDINCEKPLTAFFPHDAEVEYCAHLVIKAADGNMVPWVTSQIDILADDWLLYIGDS